MRDEPNARLRCQSRRSSDTTKGKLRFKGALCTVWRREAGQYSGTWMWVLRGNATERGDDGGGPGQSSLFFLTVSHPEIGLSGARV
ncbi:hypothetical protein Lal_00008641 [Lupinus albus]|nr:hypothetical protein Lal_00008641 [Lupinus albus]